MNRNHSSDLLTGCQLQKIHNSSTSCCTTGFWDFICLQPVNSSHIGEEIQIMMCSRHQKIFDIILINRLHSFDSTTTAVLCFKIIYGHTLDITKTGHGNDSILLRNQILHRDIQFIIADLTASVITIFFSNRSHLCLDDTQ